MALTDQAALAQNEDFRTKVQMAVLIAASQLLADPQQPFVVHKYAQQVVKNVGGGWLNAFIFQVAASPAITATSTDNDIQFTVNSNFEKLAEAHYGNI